MQVNSSFTVNSVIFWSSKANTWRFKNISCKRNEPKEYTNTWQITEVSNSTKRHAKKKQCFRRIYTTFILGTALLNFGTRASNIGHGPLDFCRVKANFSARVPKNLDGPRPPQEVVSARLKRGPRAETRGIFVLRVFVLMTDHESEGSGVENELWAAKILYFSREERWPRRI